MNWTSLVSTEALAAQIAQPGLVIVDCRFALDDIDWGERAYLEAHVPGARYVNNFLGTTITMVAASTTRRPESRPAGGVGCAISIVGLPSSTRAQARAI